MSCMIYKITGLLSVILLGGIVSIHAGDLKHEILVPGTGVIPQKGQTVTIEYTRKLADGTIVDTTHKPTRGAFNFVLGSGILVEGMEEGIAHMHVGETAQLTIPPHLGYGPKGVPGMIDPNTALIFEVELISAS